MTPPASTRGKEVRSQALASVTQDMSSSRLRILGDLMDTRKRAEQHEQEFLRTINSENAAFSQIVSLFEGTIEDVKSESAVLVDQLVAKVAAREISLGEVRSSFRGEISKDFENVGLEVLRVEKTYKECIESIIRDSGETRSDINQISESVSCLKERMEEENLRSLRASDEMSDRISTLLSDASSRADKLLSELESRVEGKIHDVMETVWRRLERIPDDFESRILSKIEESEQRLRTLIDSRLGGLEEQMEARARELVEQASLESEAKFERLFAESKQNFAHASGNITNLSEKVHLIESRSTAASSDIEQTKVLISEKFNSRFEREKNEINSIILKTVQEKINEYSNNISLQLESQSKAIQAVALSGFRHEWVVQNAASRFKSLGLLSSPNKFVSSESFSVGPYPNMQLRIFPVSTQTVDQPTVWLIHRPGAADDVIPIFVDLALGSAKRGPLKVKRMQELFGHWVWEAHFPGDILSEVDEQANLKISVEISMRQWMDPIVAAVPPPRIMNVDDDPSDLPNSPSAMSNYTFGGPLKPLLTTTNPFDTSGGDNSPNDHKSRPLTPRRSSWAQFGGDTSSSPQLVPLNPFK